MIPKSKRKLTRYHANGRTEICDETRSPWDKPKLRIDLGCGPNTKEGFEGADQYSFDGKVKHVVNLVGQKSRSILDDSFGAFEFKRWPWADGSVTEAHSSHFVEHLTGIERVHFWNELYRVLKPNLKENGVNVEGFATIVVPHWASCRAYGDPTHAWPPVSEFSFYYLDRDWRAANAPHTDAKNWPLGLNCHLEAVWGYSMHPAIQTRNQEYQQHAMGFWKEACQDIICTVCRKD
jgi:hypothetical protein